MKKEQKEQLSNAIIKLVGEKENVTFFTHCVTRLRFNVKNKELVQLEELKKQQGVLGAQWSGDQLQVIIGAEVSEVYQAMCWMHGLSEQEMVNEDLDKDIKAPEKFSLKKIGGRMLDYLSGSLAPCIPAFAGCGLLRGFLMLFSSLGWMSAESDLYILLNMVSQAAFLFIPVLLAYSAAKKLNTNITLSLVIAGVYLCPVAMGMTGNNLYILGIEFPMQSYLQSMLPILISVWIMSHVYRFVDKYTISYLKVIVVPLVTILVVSFLGLSFIGPFGNRVGVYVGSLMKKLFDIAPWLGGFVDGFVRGPLMAAGMHMSLAPIMFNNLEVLGYDMLGPVHFCTVYGSFGTCVATYLKAKKPETKQIALSAGISQFIGIGEPAAFGIALRYRRPFVANMIGGGIAGAVVATLGGKCYGYVMPSVLSLAAYGETIPVVLIGAVVAMVVSGTLTYLFGFDEEI